MQTFLAQPIPWPDTAAELRQQVRALVADHFAALGEDADPAMRANSWSHADPEFSRKLGAANLIGMIWPKEYGGHERSPLERYVVLEELLALGAPVGAHWIADRQTAGMLLKYGTEEARQRWIPGMARGEIYSCIGLSEPGAGSDLASVRTTARPKGDGWVIDGQKVWTTGAHFAHVMIALVRSEEGSERNAGLSQFVIPMDTPGVTVKPIIDLYGRHDFNEVFFDNVELPASALAGTRGEGWKQATAELSLERSGPERYLSSTALLVETIRKVGPDADAGVQRLVGQLAAEMWTLRQMSATVATRLAQGDDPSLESTMVKDLGNSFEQAMPGLIQAALEIDPAKINVNGGSIAMGHPLGATGGMILGTMVDELERSGKATALINLCVGAGMGTATVIERV